MGPHGRARDIDEGYVLRLPLASGGRRRGEEVGGRPQGFPSEAEGAGRS